MRKQFKPNCAVSVTANVARLRALIVHVLKRSYRPTGRLGRKLANRRTDYRYRPAQRMR
jgi:hypothetical protein